MALSTADLKKKIAEILKDADLETTSAKKVRTQLEEDTGSDLSTRWELITIWNYFQCFISQMSIVK